MAKLKPRIPETIRKAPTGIAGLDEVTDGGLPVGRPTLVCGGPGCGKTLLAMEFLVHGATQYNEPGIFISFEESMEELAQNVASLGFNLEDLQRRKKIALDHVRVERSEIEETGEYDLDGLFLRLKYAIDLIGARRIVLDTIESLFSALSNESILRAELRRLFHWLKGQGLTAVITAERGEGWLTRQGLEEYVSDCVILLDHRVIEQMSTRRLRIVKYRGSTHGTNEYPFLITRKGISVLPITSLGLTHQVSRERVSSGVPALDEMLGGKGYFKGSSVLISGTAGTGKSSLAAYFANATCRRGERCLFFAFEESSHQIIRNMESIDLKLEPHVARGLLQFHASRPTVHGLEMHLAVMHELIEKIKPATVVIDPITNLLSTGSQTEVHSMLLRMIDYLKTQRITAFFTSLSQGINAAEQTDIGISSIMDTWLFLRDIERDGERNRGIHVLKSRGMAHSNQVREFMIGNEGISLREVYLGPAGLLTGSARLIQEARERAETKVREEEIERKRRELEGKRKTMQARIAALEAEFELQKAELERNIALGRQREGQLTNDRQEIAHSRKVAEALTAESRKRGNGHGR